MKSAQENGKAASGKKEILGEVAELLKEAGFLTDEEKNCIKNMIWQEDALKKI